MNTKTLTPAENRQLESMRAALKETPRSPFKTYLAALKLRKVVSAGEWPRTVALVIDRAGAPSRLQGHTLRRLTPLKSVRLHKRIVDRNEVTPVSVDEDSAHRWMLWLAHHPGE